MNEKKIQENPLRRQILDLGPLLLFFACNYFFGIFWGTATLVIATLISLSISWILEKRIPILAAFGCSAVVFFGALTLIFQDDIFIKLKPTIVSLIIALALFFAEIMGRQPLKVIMSSGIKLTNVGWRHLTRVWILMFIIMAVSNEIAWRNLSTDDWVTFKAFGIPLLSIVFAILSLPIMRRYIIEEDTKRTKTGLALSSRNKLLSQEGLIKAENIYKALALIQNELNNSKNLIEIINKGKSLLVSENIHLDYLEILDMNTFLPPNESSSDLVVIIAVLIDGVRLIDNIQFKY